MTQEQQGHGADKPAADDVAADMERRLDELGEHLHDAERQAGAIPENPLSAVAGDPEAIAEGPLSGGATLSAAGEQHEPRRHLPREAPHERPLSRDELDEERWFEEQGDEMESRVHDLEHDIEDADRVRPPHPGPTDADAEADG